MKNRTRRGDARHTWEGRIHVAVFMNQKGISVERERPIEREGGGEARRMSRCGVVVRVYNDDARANFKEAYRACSSPARNILSASLAFRAGHQTLLSPATKRFTPFQTRCSAPTARQPNGKQTERKEEKHRQKRAISCRNIRRRKFRYQATIRYLFVAVTSSEK